MSVIGSNVLAGASGQAVSAAGYEITRSLRFNDDDSAYLGPETFSSPTSSTAWTWAGWIKKTLITTSTDYRGIFDAGSGSNYAYLDFSDNGIRYVNRPTSGTIAIITTTPVFRDPSAWFHLVFVYDSANGTSTDRLRLYINGTRVTTFSSATYPDSSQASVINSAVAHRIGFDAGNSGYLDACLADVHFIDGVSGLTASDFGEFDDNNVWQPKAYSGTYGTNGFHLKFDNASDLGEDAAGSNDWTVNNLVAEQPLRLPAVGQTQAGNSYLSVPASDDFNFGTGDFTIELFLYVIRSGSNNAIFDFRDSGSSAQYFLRLTSSTSCNLRYSGTDLGTFSITSGSWNHVAISRSSGTTKIFVNGTQTNSFSDTNDASNTGPLLFGTFNDTTGSSSSYGFDGQISNLRIVKGTAVYTSAFTTPTAPLTNITNTKLLCCQSSSSATAAAVSPGTITASNSFPTSFSDSTSANDSLVDSPTNGTQTDTGAGGEVVGNYATLNPLISPASTYLSDGNLKLTQTTTSWVQATSTIGVNSGKWYWEVLFEGTNTLIGVTSNPNSGSYIGQVTGSYGRDAGGGYYINGGNGSGFTSFASGTTLGVALDMDNGTVTLYFNGSAESTFATGLDTSKTFYAGVSVYGSSSNTINFGQRPFAYTAPSGYKALCTTNLPDPTIADGSTAMDVVARSGGGTTQTLGFGADLVWSKRRDAASNHYIFDVIRGGSLYLSSNTTSAETSLSNYVTFNSTGYQISSTWDWGASASVVDWVWDAGTSTVSNTDGSITSSVRANASAGFSIVSWTGTGANGTIGHGLNSEPHLIIVKLRNNTIGHDWSVYSKPTGNTHLIKLNEAAAASSAPLAWNNTTPTTSVFTVIGVAVNENTKDVIAYCWAPVEGYSAFGSYTGNGSTDGPFVYTGFRPAFIMFKRTDSTGNWEMYDSTRDTYNPYGLVLEANTANAEADVRSGYPADMLSNGFKLRHTGAAVNASGGTYIYAAFAEHPFKYSRAR